MLQIIIENTGLFLLGAAYAAAPMALLAGLNEIAIRLLLRRRWRPRPCGRSRCKGAVPPFHQPSRPS
jgi:hypothetical protein